MFYVRSAKAKRKNIPKVLTSAVRRVSRLTSLFVVILLYVSNFYEGKPKLMRHSESNRITSLKNITTDSCCQIMTKCQSPIYSLSIFTGAVMSFVNWPMINRLNDFTS